MPEKRNSRALSAARIVALVVSAVLVVGLGYSAVAPGGAGQAPADPRPGAGG